MQTALYCTTCANWNDDDAGGDGDGDGDGDDNDDDDDDDGDDRRRARSLAHRENRAWYALLAGGLQRLRDVQSLQSACRAVINESST